MDQTARKSIKIIGPGLLTWLVPFVLAFPFYSPSGELTISIFLFKTIMIVVSGTFGALLLVWYFLGIQKDYLREGIVVGLVWLLINWTLDILLLLPVSGMDLPTYFGEIGLRYLIIPVMAIAIGYSVARGVEQKDQGYFRIE